MELTGSLYQDLSNLKNLYNESGKVILTGNKDVDYQILAHLEIDDLSKVCRSNKYTQQLCNHTSFWQYKFKSEELEILADINDLSMWLRYYKTTKIARDYAKYSLLIYDIQYKNKIHPSIDIFNNNDDYLFNNLFNIIGYPIEGKIDHISIMPTGINYNITIDFLDNNAKITLPREILIRLLTFIYSYSWPNGDIFNIYCEELPLIINDDYINERPNRNQQLLYTRKGILDSVMYYES